MTHAPETGVMHTWDRIHLVLETCAD